MEIGQFLVFFMKVLISSTASGPGNHVFIQTGGSVELDIKNKTLPEFNSLVWMKDMSDNIVKFISQSGYIREHSSYKNRVEFNTETFSVTLRNMKKTDSGIYMAKTKGDQEICVAKHNISVIDPVDFPILKENFTMISVNVCIVNVSCSGRDHTISNRYYSNNCTQEKVTSFGIQTLVLYCIENIIVCNYSNPVSWKNDTVEIHQLCTSHEQNIKEINSSFPLHWLLVIAGVSVLVFTAVSVICCSYKKCKKSAQQNDQTVYAQVQLRNDMQRPLEMLEKSANPQTVYGFTGEYKQTHNISPTMPTPQIRKQVQKENHPSTTYSTIGQNQKPSFASETDHTIYSAVCKSMQGRQPVHK
ncbi:natural killer cell receptor 2B4-like isoform X2 [Carassius carassius]|uniref:natural killer cell receptor 2B4-like isoform X2 n=1 Tax=Carassius carassius TaxID=217509 RepID=UPI0028692CCB|nr:natural killer cell receptor 2B4-like isoform X2 [Carassius carassius]